MFDGLADFPDETPLKKAYKPNIDFFARNGLVSRLRLIKKDLWSEETRASVSHIANTSFLGYDPKKFNNKRGILEAISAGIEYKSGWLAIRCDFGTIKNGIVVDRRAGRNTFGLDIIEKDINKKIRIGVKFLFKRTYGHRAVLVLKENLDDNIQLNDPLSANLPPREILPLRKKAEKSARIVRKFVEEVNRLLENHPVNKIREQKKIPPANCLLLREAGNRIKFLRPFFTTKYKIKAIVVSEPGVMKATCILAGFDSIDIPENLDYRKGIEFIFEKIEELLPTYDFIYSHIKWTDEAAHDKNPNKKREIIEFFDKNLEVLRNFKGKIIITTDHITSCETGKHEFGEVPILVYPFKSRKRFKTFNEEVASKSKVISPNQLWKIVFASS